MSRTPAWLRLGKGAVASRVFAETETKCVPFPRGATVQKEGTFDKTVS